MPTGTDAEIAKAVAKLQSLGVPNVLVTIGSGGSLLFQKDSPAPLRQAPFLVQDPMDTTGAGDCFRGAFAACLAAGRSLGATTVGPTTAGPAQALELGAAASAHCVTVSPHM